MGILGKIYAIKIDDYKNEFSKKENDFLLENNIEKFPRPKSN